jgi:hypothetical protein
VVVVVTDGGLAGRGMEEGLLRKMYMTRVRLAKKKKIAMRSQKRRFLSGGMRGLS